MKNKSNYSKDNSRFQTVRSMSAIHAYFCVFFSWRACHFKRLRKSQWNESTIVSLKSSMQNLFPLETKEIHLTAFMVKDYLKAMCVRVDVFGTRDQSKTIKIPTLCTYVDVNTLTIIEFANQLHATIINSFRFRLSKTNNNKYQTSGYRDSKLL